LRSHYFASAELERLADNLLNMYGPISDFFDVRRDRYRKESPEWCLRTG